MLNPSKIILFIVTSIFIATSFADVGVNGCYRQDSANAQSHCRDPDANQNNNWSTKSNANQGNDKGGTQTITPGIDR